MAVQLWDAILNERIKPSKVGDQKTVQQNNSDKSHEEIDEEKEAEEVEEEFHTDLDDASEASQSHSHRKTKPPLLPRELLEAEPQALRVAICDTVGEPERKAFLRLSAIAQGKRTAQKWNKVVESKISRKRRSEHDGVSKPVLSGKQRLLESRKQGTQANKSKG